jgi:hypothetical protein
MHIGWTPELKTNYNSFWEGIESTTLSILIMGNALPIL